jgi:hypothetical protein
MKKIFIASIALVVAVGFYSCKKKNEVVSKVVTASYPTITVDGSNFYSIKTGGALPTIKASAYDSLLKEVCPISLDASGLDNSAPGLNVLAIKSSNSLGYSSSRNVVVAVTNVDAAYDLSGNYRRNAGAKGVSVVSKVQTGLYYSSNIFGASDPTLIAGFYFLHVNDSTIIIPEQETDFGTMKVANVALSIVPGGDTLYKYSLKTLTTNAAVRTFIKE